MGSTYKATCLKCDNSFEVDEGDGMRFHLLRCNKCGETKSIGFDELGELFLRYEAGLGAKRVKGKKRMSEREYNKGVETFAGNCQCGGSFTFNARTRCPKCHSTKLERGEDVANYD